MRAWRDERVAGKLVARIGIGFVAAHPPSAAGIMQSKCLSAGNGTYGNLTDLWDTDRPAPITPQYEEVPIFPPRSSRD